MHYQCTGKKIVMQKQQEKGKKEEYMCTDGDKNIPLFLFLTATLELLVLPKWAPVS